MDNLRQQNHLRCMQTMLDSQESTFQLVKDFWTMNSILPFHMNNPPTIRPYFHELFMFGQPTTP